MIDREDGTNGVHQMCQEHQLSFCATTYGSKEHHVIHKQTPQEIQVEYTQSDDINRAFAYHHSLTERLPLDLMFGFFIAVAN